MVNKRKTSPYLKILAQQTASEEEKKGRFTEAQLQSLANVKQVMENTQLLLKGEQESENSQNDQSPAADERKTSQYLDILARNPRINPQESTTKANNRAVALTERIIRMTKESLDTSILEDHSFPEPTIEKITPPEQGDAMAALAYFKEQILPIAEEIATEDIGRDNSYYSQKMAKGLETLANTTDPNQKQYGR